MNDFYLTFDSVGFFNTTLFTGALIYLLARAARNSPVNIWMVAFQAMWLIASLASFISVSWLDPRSIYAWYGGLSAFVAAPLYLQVLYRFHGLYRQREARRVWRITAGATLLGLAWAVYATLGDRAFFSMPAQLYVFDNAARAAAPITILSSLQHLWAVTLLIRRRRTAGAIARRQHLILMLLSAGSLVATWIGFVALFIPKVWALYYFIIIAGSIVGLLVYFLLFVSSARTATLLDRIQGLAFSAVTLVSVVVGVVFLGVFDREIQQLRAVTVNELRKFSGAERLAQLPEFVQYVTLRPANAAEAETLLYAAPGADPFALTPGHFSKRSEQPFAYRMADPRNALTYYIEYLYRDGDRRYRIGFRYVDARIIMHELTLYLLGATVVIAAGVMTLLPWAYRRFIATRLDLLLAAIQRVNRGDFNVRVPIKTRDEIGDITRNFNRMTSSVRRLLEKQERLTALEKELQIARSIQLATLPARSPAIQGLRITGSYTPMDAIGGDFYDYLSAPRGLGVLVADVCGHGIPAALGASMVKIAFAGQSAIASEPHRVLSAMNAALIGRLQHSFLTAAYAYYDFDTRSLMYSSAGHPPPLLHRRSSDEFHELFSPGLGIGIRAESEYKSNLIELVSGDRLALFTDGIVECRNQHDELFGDDRFRNFLAEHADSDPDQLSRACLERLRRWSRLDGGFEDDFTLVLVDVL